MVISDKIQENREESRTFFNTEQAKDRRRPGVPTSLASAVMGLSTLSQEVIMML
jgi:transcription initiation factor TFIIIB Brf1 subunit/transcription initiation factor TFIIB